VFCGSAAQRFPDRRSSSRQNKIGFIFAFFDREFFTKPAQRMRMSQPAQQRRRLLRRTRYHSSWIAFENDIRSYECQVLDISADGAKLIADIDARIGATFRLSAVPQAIVRRSCEVVWRKGRTIGVKFVPETAKAK
jgi:hypothetical protein